MAVFARLKDGETVAPRLCGKYLYPGLKTWVKFEDQYYDLLKTDIRIELMNQEEMNVKIDENKQKIEDIVNSQWRSAEKQIMVITDMDLLKEALIAAKNASKTKISQMIEDRIEELSVK